MLSAQTIYSGTRSLFTQGFGRFGIEVEFVDDPRDLDEWRRRIRPNTSAIYAESIANPRNDVIDLRGVAACARRPACRSSSTTPSRRRTSAADRARRRHRRALGEQVPLRPRGGARRRDRRRGHVRLVVAARRASRTCTARTGLQGRSCRRRTAGAYTAYIRGVAGRAFGPRPRRSTRSSSGRASRRCACGCSASRDGRCPSPLARGAPEVLERRLRGPRVEPLHELGRRYLPRGRARCFIVLRRRSGRRRGTSTGGEADQAHEPPRRRPLARPPPASTTHAHVEERERAGGRLPGTVRLSIGIEDIDDIQSTDLDQGDWWRGVARPRARDGGAL